MSVPISRIVDRIFQDYDHNQNGVIDLKGPGKGNVFQRIRDEIRNPDEGYRMDDYQGGGMVAQPPRVFHHLKLFHEADTNGDMKVTREELTAVVSRFDKDGDGKLSTRGLAFWEPKGEKQHFERAFGEEWDN